MARRALIWVFILAIGLLFLQAIQLISNGFIPFWYDPGRDLLLSLDNLKKFSLIGPPSGIPGVFYLPYWTWLLSLPLIITRDPRIIVFTMTTLPYFLLIPLILIKMNRTFGKIAALSLATIFFISYQNLTTQIWSPNLAPLYYLALASLFYLLPEANPKRLYLIYFLIGLVATLGVGFNMGFGIGIFLVTIAFVTMNLFKHCGMSLKLMKLFATFCFGITVVLLPYFFFEMRHSFLQTISLEKIVTGQTVIGLAGLSKVEIIKSFLKIPGTIFGVHWFIGLIILGISLILLQINRKRIDNNTKSLVAFLVTSLLGLAAVYLLARNPKWDYHFVGVEMIFLLLIGASLSRSFAKLILPLIALSLLFTHFVFPIKNNFSQNLYLNQKLQIIDSIYKDTHGSSFSFAAYNPAIYTYDYNYLFNWLGKEKYHLLPTTNTPQNSTTYLIVPPTDSVTREGFVESKTPEILFKTALVITHQDGTYIIKRVKIQQ